MGAPVMINQQVLRRGSAWRLAGKALADSRAGSAPSSGCDVGTLWAVRVVANFYDASLSHDVQFSIRISFIVREGGGNDTIPFFSV